MKERTSVEKAVAFVLAAGTVLSTGLILGGLVWAIAAESEMYRNEAPIPLEMLLGQLLTNAYAVIQLGILILLATPLLRVAVAGGLFAVSEHKKSAFVSVGVFLIVLLTIILT